MRMKEKLELKSTSDRKEIVSLLRDGKIGLFPTDTVWGICCRMDNESSVNRVFEIKNREKNKPFLILAENVLQIKKYAVVDEFSHKKIFDFWPGPLTVVLKAKKENVLPVVRAQGDTIGVRIPDYEEILEIIKNLGVPIVAPSANISGENTPTEFKEIDKRIVDAVDFIVEGECKMKKPSTIVDCSSEKIKIIREGAIDFKI